MLTSRPPIQYMRLFRITYQAERREPRLYGLPNCDVKPGITMHHETEIFRSHFAGSTLTVTRSHVFHATDDTIANCAIDTDSSGS
jgi:hypothetical protein